MKPNEISLFLVGCTVAIQTIYEQKNENLPTSNIALQSTTTHMDFLIRGKTAVNSGSIFPIYTYYLILKN